MLIVALVLAVIGLAALVTAVVTSNELVAWVCIAASVLGVLLLIVDALRERQRRGAEADEDVAHGETPAVAAGDTVDETYKNFDAEYPEEEEPAEPAEPAAEETATRPAEAADEAAADDKSR
jgi:hypothetical protein